MMDFDGILTNVKAETSQPDSVLALIIGLRQQTRLIHLLHLSAIGLTPAQQTEVDKIFAAAEGSKVKIVEALAANQAQAPSEEPPPESKRTSTRAAKAVPSVGL